MTTAPRTVNGLIRLAKKDPASFFFSPGAMSFFQSHTEPELYPTSDPKANRQEGYFLTSERFESDPREWSIRRYTITPRPKETPVPTATRDGMYRDHKLVTTTPRVEIETLYAENIRDRYATKEEATAALLAHIQADKS